MKKLYLIPFFMLSLFYTHLEAQQARYLEPIFDDVTVTEDIVYGNNASIIGMLLGDTEARPEDLLLDLYQPVGDTETERPLVLLFHSGSFLPEAFTGSVIGSKKAYALVDIATKLAKRGYVVASCDYRLGWNPLAQNQDPLLFGIMNATYRGIQDTRNAIRFFKHHAVEEGNTYGIDTSKIVVWGNGTGGFLSLGAASLDRYVEEIAMVPKFYVGGAPVVHPSFNGDLNGTSVGIVSDPAPIGYPNPAGDTLCYVNYPNYSSDFQLAVDMGGAVGDSSWIDENTVPIISFHVKSDSVTPCGVGTVFSYGHIPIIEVSGPCHYQGLQHQIDNQEEWYNFPWDNYTIPNDMKPVADSRNGGLEGFFPFETDVDSINTPWDFWAEGDEGPFPLDVDVAKATIDSAIAYFAPRACITLDLGCDFTIPINEIQAQKIDLQAFPNPASESVHFNTKEYPMLGIKVFDLTGRLVKEYSNINEYSFEMQKGNLGNGIYSAQVWFEDGFLSTRIIFQN
jgi:acetyl esterase/lipase